MYLINKVKNKADEFLLLCRTHNVKMLYGFGSSIRNDFNDKTSDIDLFIELQEDDPIERGEILMNIWDKLELFFQRKVDLLTIDSLQNPVLKKNVDSTKQLIYDGKSSKILV